MGVYNEGWYFFAPRKIYTNKMSPRGQHSTVTFCPRGRHYSINSLRRTLLEGQILSHHARISLLLCHTYHYQCSHWHTCVIIIAHTYTEHALYRNEEAAHFRWVGCSSQIPIGPPRVAAMCFSVLFGNEKTRTRMSNVFDFSLHFTTV